MLDLLITAAFWSTAIAGAVPIAFAALGALLASRAGVLFIGVEAALLSSTFGALAVALTTGSTLAGVVGGAVVGSITALVFAFLSMSLGMGDVVAGIILLILTIGVTGFLLSDWFPQGLTIGADLMGPSWPATGNATLDLFLHQPILVYVGTKDQPIEGARRARELNPRLQLIELPGDDHATAATRVSVVVPEMLRMIEDAPTA